MIPKELLKQVKRIQIQTSRLVNDVLAGEYHSTFRGSGIEFEEVREYQPGDEIRSIDWNVTARVGRPFIKKFVEERELTVMLMVDASSSGQFGTFEKFKNQFAAEVCAVLSFSAIKNNDNVGLIIFTDRVEKYIPPKKGRKHVLRVIREVLFFEPEHNGTDVQAALDFLNSISKRRAVVFLVSDFLASGYERSLQVSNKRHDIIALMIQDPRETHLPDVGILELQDAETGEVVLVDTHEASIRKGFQALAEKDVRERDRFFKQIGVDTVLLRTDRPYTDPLIRFFRSREKRR